MTAVIGCLGLAWGVSALPTSEATDDFRDLETHLLRFETFSPAALTQTLQAFEARKGSQIAVLIVPTTAPEAIEQYSIRVAEAWKIGS